MTPKAPADWEFVICQAHHCTRQTYINACPHVMDGAPIAQTSTVQVGSDPNKQRAAAMCAACVAAGVDAGSLPPLCKRCAIEKHGFVEKPATGNRQPATITQ